MITHENERGAYRNNLHVEQHQKKRKAEERDGERMDGAVWSCSKPMLLRAVDSKHLIRNQNSYQLFNRYRVHQLQRRRHGRRWGLRGKEGWRRYCTSCIRVMHKRLEFSLCHCLWKITVDTLKHRTMHFCQHVLILFSLFQCSTKYQTKTQWL